MLGSLYTLVDGRTECKRAGNTFGHPIKDVMHRHSGDVPRPAAAGGSPGSFRGLSCGRCAGADAVASPTRSPFERERLAGSWPGDAAERSESAAFSEARSQALPDAQVLQILDRGPHLASVPRRPVVAFRQPRNTGAAAHGDQLDHQMLRAVVLAQAQEPLRQADRGKLAHTRTS